MISSIAENLNRRWAESRRFRRLSVFTIGFLSLATLLTVVINPLPVGLVSRFYWNSRWLSPHLFEARMRAVDVSRYVHEFPYRVYDLSIEWQGAILIPRQGEYEFTFYTKDWIELHLDNRPVVENRSLQANAKKSFEVYLDNGFHEILIRYANAPGDPYLKALWRPPGGYPLPLAQAGLFARMPRSKASYTLFRVRRFLFPILLLAWTLCLVLWFIALTGGARAKLGAGGRISKRTLALLAFFLLIGLALNLLLGWLIDGTVHNDKTTLDRTWFFLSSPAHNTSDSWWPMYAAIRHLRAHPRNGDLYARIFFESHIKFQYPPMSLFLVMPFSGMSIDSFASTMNFLAWLMVLISTLALARIYSLALRRFGAGEEKASEASAAEKTVRWLALACFTLTFNPLIRPFTTGHIQTWLYFFFILALWAWLENRKTAAGVLTGLICIVKPYMLLLLFWGMLRKQWRFVAGLAVLVLVASIVSLSLFGLGNHWEYLKVLSFMNKHGESFYTNQSVNGLLHRIQFNGTNLHGNPFSFAPYNAIAFYGSMISACILVFIALFWKYGKLRWREKAGVLDFTAACLCFTMASPIVWEHHYAILLPVFAIALAAALGAGGKRPIFLLGLAFALCCNFYQVANILAHTRFNFLQSTLFFGALVLLFLLYRMRAREVTQ